MTVTPEITAEFRPYVSLSAAVLIQAMKDYYLPTDGTGKSKISRHHYSNNQRLRDEARSWFLGMIDGTGCFGYFSVCALLKLDPQSLRRQVFSGEFKRKVGHML